MKKIIQYSLLLAATSAFAGTPISTVNSVDVIVADMRLMNDIPLAGIDPNIGWARGPGYVNQGIDARGSATPDWWQPANRFYKSDVYWKFAIPWYVIFDGVGNQATNTRVQLRNLKIYVKSRKSGQWVLLGQNNFQGEAYPKTLTGTTTFSGNVRQESASSVSIKPDTRNVYHGWCCGLIALPDPADVAGIFVTMQARLIVDNQNNLDDRERARYLIQMGADYYPEQNTRISDFAPTGYNPGIGVSRSKLVTNEWQAFNFATIDSGVVTKNGSAMSEAQFKANPPPLD